MYDDICACSELRDHCFKKAEQERDFHFIAFIIKINYYYYPMLGSCRPEGFVIRTVQSFSYDELDKNVVKYVRKNHVQTNSDWRLKWKQAKLRKP